jgi:uncharacterized protein (TIGR02996 family)
MTSEQELLSGIVAHPLELERWLILADWLEDQQDPRAELARLRFFLQTEPEHPQRAERQARQLELLDAGLAPVVPTWTNSLGMEFALMLPGTFLMGSPESEDEHSDDEILHPVTLSQPFLLGVSPVTVSAFQSFVAATNYQTQAEKSGEAYAYLRDRWLQDPSINWRNPAFEQTKQHPVVCLSWNDTQKMVSWLNTVEGRNGLVYSLPTEAQWEYACRAGTTTTYWWGDDASRLGEYAWFQANSEYKTHPVATRKPNPWGLYDMHGHVWEWCADLYGDYPSSAVQDPRGASEGSEGVFRGGSWCNGAADCRSAYRVAASPRLRTVFYGCRLAVAVRLSEG